MTQRSITIFRFDLQRMNDQLIIELAGELGRTNARRLHEAFAALADSEERELWVDLGRVSCIDSSCLAVLVWARNRCRAHGRRLMLRSPSGAVVAALAASGLLRSFRYDASSLDEGETWPTRLPAQLNPAESSSLSMV